MKFLLIGFSTDKNDWISRAIRKLTWSKWSHVVLISPDGESFIESTHSAGVKELPISFFLSKENHEVAKIPHPCPEKVWELAKKELGKPYDHSYIYGWFFRKNWQDDEKWACCELIPALTNHTGYPVIRCKELIKVTPEILYMISFPIGGDKWK